MSTLKINHIEPYTGSIVSIDGILHSQTITDLSESLDARIIAATNEQDLSSFATITDVETLSSYVATTGSNTFVGDQTINGDLNVHDVTINNALYVIDNVNNSGIGGAVVTGYIDPLRDFRVLSIVSGGPIVVGMTVEGVGVNSGVTITALPGAGGSSIGTYKINGQLTKVGSKYSPITFTVGYPISGDSYITGSLTWDLDGNFWKAGVIGTEIQIANVDYVDEVNTTLSDLISASYVTTASFNTYTSSYSASQSTLNNAQSVRLTTLESFTSSFSASQYTLNNAQSVRLTTLESFTSSYYTDSASAFTTRTANALSITSLNTFTSSFSASQYTLNNAQSSRLTTLEASTGSYALSTTLSSFSSSIHTEISNIAVANASTGSTILGVTAKTGATGVVAHDCSVASVFYHTSPAANFTVNFTNLGLTTNKYRQIKLVILQGSTNRVPTAVQIDGTPVSVSFKGSTGHNSLTDICTFDIINNGGTYIVLADIYGGY